jgi:hypothetical protein
MAGLMEEPLFELRGAGFVQASKIRPSFDPMDGSWNTTFTFFSPGAIDVTFSGLHRKSFLKVVRRVNVEPVSANDPSSDPRGASAPSAGNPGTGSTPQEDASVGTPASPSATPPSNDRGAKWL